jgi:hypothetical protein
MRYLTSTLTACALAGTISAFAQQPPQNPPPQNPPPAQEPAQSPEPTTLTGCVQEAKTTDGGTAYILTKVQGGTAEMYLLLGPPPSELATHINHKVAVTGQVKQPAPAAAAAEQPPPEKKVLRPPSIQIEAVKMVAETCQ